MAFFGEIDQSIIEIMTELQKYFANHFTKYITAGQALGAMMSVFVVAGEAYKVMLQQKAFDILAIIRPIAFALVIANWIAFVTAIGAIPRLMENDTKEMFFKEQMALKSLRTTRFEAAKKLKDRTMEARAAADIAKQQLTDGNMWDKVVEMGQDFLHNIGEQLASFYLIFDAGIDQLIEDWIMKIGYFFWGVMVYLLFFTKEVFAGILIITGPITFGLSVLPAFKDAWTQWIARYVSVLLYGFIGFLLLSACLRVVEYGIRTEINILVKANSSMEGYAAYLYNSGISTFTQLTIIVAGTISLRMVPEIATWIIPSQTVHAAGGFVSGVKSTIRKGVTSGIKLATGGR